ncbi:hypothetical protein Esti_006854 [Eimeria stiedai]
MSRRFNRGAPQKSPRGSLWDDEGGPRFEGPPKEVPRRTVVVLGPTTPQRAEGPSRAPPSRPIGSVPVLTPSPDAVGGALQQQGASAGAPTPSDSAGEGPQGAPSDRRRLPLMALSDIIRQQHAKGKVSHIGRADRGPSEGPPGGPSACASPASWLKSRPPLIFLRPQAVTAAQQAACVRPVQQQQQQMLQQQQDRSPSTSRRQQQQQGSVRNALFGAERGLQRGGPPSGPTVVEARRVRDVSGPSPASSRDDSRHGGPFRGPPEGPQYPRHSAQLRERPSLSPAFSRDPEGSRGPPSRRLAAHGGGEPDYKGRRGPAGTHSYASCSDEEQGPRGSPTRGGSYSPEGPYEEVHKSSSSGWGPGGARAEREARGPRKRGSSPLADDQRRGGGFYEGHRQHRRHSPSYRGGVGPRGPRFPGGGSPYGSPPSRGPPEEQHFGRRRLQRGPYEGHGGGRRGRSYSRGGSGSEGAPQVYSSKRSPGVAPSPSSSSPHHRREDHHRVRGRGPPEGGPHREEAGPLSRRRSVSSRSRSPFYQKHHHHHEHHHEGCPSGGTNRGPHKSATPRDREEGRWVERRVYCSRSRSRGRRHRRGGPLISRSSSSGSIGSNRHGRAPPRRGPSSPRRRSMSSSSRRSSSRGKGSYRDRVRSRRSGERAPRRGPPSRSLRSGSRELEDHSSGASRSGSSGGPSPRPRLGASSSPDGAPSSTLLDDQEKWRRRREELQRRLRGGGGANGSPPITAAGAAQTAAGKEGGAWGAPGADWRHQQPSLGAYSGGPQGGPLGVPHSHMMMMQQNPNLRAPDGFYSAQGPSSSGRDRGPPSGAPLGSSYSAHSLQEAPLPYSPHSFPPPQGSPAAAWQQRQHQQQQQYSSSVWGPVYGEPFMGMPGDMGVPPYRGPRGPPDGYRRAQHPPHVQRDLQQQQLTSEEQQQQQHQEPGEASEGNGGFRAGRGPPPLPGAGGAAGGPPSHQAQPAGGGAPGEGPPTRACRDFVMGGRCPRGPACTDLHPPPQEYHKFDPHSLLLQGTYLAEASELRRRFAADATVKQQQHQQQQQVYEQQQQQQHSQRARHRQQQQPPGGGGGPPPGRGGAPPPPHPPVGMPSSHHHAGGPSVGALPGPPRPSGPPMGAPYLGPSVGPLLGMQGYPQVYGSPQMGLGGPLGPPHSFRGLEGPYGPPGPPRGRMLMGPGGPLGSLPEAPPPFIMRTPRPMQGPPGEGVPRPPPPEPPRGAGGPWFGPGGAPPPPFPHQILGGPPSQAGPLKKRKGSAGKGKAKRQRKQQQQQEEGPLSPQQQPPFGVQGDGPPGAPGGPPPLEEAEEALGASAADPAQQQHVEHQQQQDEEEEEPVEGEEERQQQQEQQEMEEEPEAAAFARTDEQQAALMEYFSSKTPEFLASDAYLEGWNKKDLIEYFYDQYLQQDMTSADALASATSYVEKPEAYGLVGGAAAEEDGGDPAAGADSTEAAVAVAADAAAIAADAAAVAAEATPDEDLACFQ